MGLQELAKLKEYSSFDEAIYDRVLQFYWNSDQDHKKIKETSDEIADRLVDDICLLVIKKLINTPEGLNLVGFLQNQSLFHKYINGEDIPKDSNTNAQINSFESELSKFKSKLSQTTI